jgi:UDP-glucose 4-epimerase
VSDGEDLSTIELVRRIGIFMNQSPLLFSVPISVLEVVGKLTGKYAEISRLIGTLQVDITASRDVLGWTPSLTVDASLRETVDWYLRRDNFFP